MLQKVAIILPNLKAGGAERVTVNIANTLALRGYKVDLVLLSAHGQLLSDLSPNINVVNLNVKRMRWCVISLAKYLHSARPAAALACMWPLTFISLLAKHVAQVTTRVIIVEHTTWSRSELFSSPFTRWKIRSSMHYFFPHADGIVTVSKGAADDLSIIADLNRSKIKVIYNPVVGTGRPISEEALAPSSWWNGNHKRILAVGTLKAIKDYSTLIKAFELLCKHLNARLLILGEGECRSELEAQIRELNLEDSVFLPGFVKDTSPYYQHADLHVLSSVGEGLPTVLIEALAMGTPIVSTDCPSGPREILNDGEFGRLVPVGSAADLAAAMAESLAFIHDREALKARAQDFTIDKAVDQYETLLFPSDKSQ